MASAASAAEGSEKADAEEKGTEEKGTEEEGTEKDGAPAAAQQEDTALYGPGFRLVGDVMLGYRIVDTDGRFAKFREDIDLSDGLRMIQGEMTLVPGGSVPARWYDRIRLRGSGLFGDPYESWGLDMRKSGVYRLEINGRSADYFNQLSGVHHAWDLTRSNSDARLTVTPTDYLQVSGSFSRFRQTGMRQTTRDFSRDEFVFDEPLDQEGITWGLGARLRLGNTVLWADQQFHSFDDNGGFGSRGLNTGLGTDDALLTFFEQREVRSNNAPTSRGGLTSTLADGKVRVSADVLYSDQELGFAFSRFLDGANFQQRPLQVSQDALGTVQRDVRHGNVRVLWQASDRLNLAAHYRRRGWDQDARQFHRTIEAFLDTGGFTVSEGEEMPSYEVTLDQYAVGADFAVASSLSLFAEVGLTNRDQRFDIVEAHASETETVRYKLGTRIRPSRRFDMEASYERGDVDDPFTRISPTETSALKLKARVRPDTRWQLSGTLTYADRTNDVTPVELQTLNFGFNVAYQQSASRWLMLSYARLDYESSVPLVFRPFFGGSATGLAENSIADNVVTASGQYRVGDGPATLLGRVTYVDSASVLPSLAFTPALRASPEHDIRFADWMLGLRYDLMDNLYGQVSGRFVDYEETTDLATDQDDYDASIFTLALGLRF